MTQTTSTENDFDYYDTSDIKTEFTIVTRRCRKPRYSEDQLTKKRDSDKALDDTTHDGDYESQDNHTQREPRDDYDNESQRRTQ